MLFFHYMPGNNENIIQIPDAGNLAEIPFPRVLARFVREKKSGTLDIRDNPPQEGGKILKRILIADGERFAVQGGAKNETLGEILKEKGKLNDEQYESLINDATGPDGKVNYGKIEQTILSGQVVPPAEIPDLLSLQAAIKIKSLFPTIRGHYQFKEQPAGSLDSKQVLVPVTYGKIILEGVGNHYPIIRINKEFPGIENKNFKPSAEKSERLNGMGLPPNILRWLRSLPESFTWNSMVKGAPVDKEQATAILMALYFAEIIMLPENQEDFPVGNAYLEKAAPKKEEKKPEIKPEAEDKQKKAAPKTEPKKPEEPKLPIEQMLDKELSDQELVAEIEKLLDTATKKDATHFDVLGVNEKTSPDKVKKIYFKFAKKFHPDARPDLFKDDVKEKVEDLFTKVSEAYNTLTDSELREEYLKMAQSKVSKEDMDKAQRAIEAEMEFQKAEILLKKSSWAQAVETLERAVKLQSDEPEYQLHLAWALYRQKGPGQAGKARKAIKEALDQRPKVAEGFYYLGQIEKAEGNLEKAEDHFLKATKLKPHDVDMKRELQLLQRRRVQQAAAPKEKKGGLFGRKK